MSPFSSYPVPTYLRLTRVGNNYTAYWGSDGVNWNQLGTFTDSLVVTGLAPYAWNYACTPSQAPALTATFDWFHNLATSGTPVAATPTFSPASGTSFSYDVECVDCGYDCGGGDLLHHRWKHADDGVSALLGSVHHQCFHYRQSDRYGQRLYAKRPGLGQLYLFTGNERSSGIG